LTLRSQITAEVISSVLSSRSVLAQTASPPRGASPGWSSMTEVVSAMLPANTATLTETLAQAMDPPPLVESKSNVSKSSSASSLRSFHGGEAPRPERPSSAPPEKKAAHREPPSLFEDKVPDDARGPSTALTTTTTNATTTNATGASTTTQQQQQQQGDHHQQRAPKEKKAGSSSSLASTASTKNAPPTSSSSSAAEEAKTASTTTALTAASSTTAGSTTGSTTLLPGDETNRGSWTFGDTSWAGSSTATSDLLWGTEEEANPYRDEIVRTIFGDVGAIRRDFSCAIERKILLHGRLYVTDRFICFYSNLFGFEKKIKIPYSYITCITKEYTAVFIPNAIAVITARREYIFRSFWDRDECYAVLKQMHDMYRGVVETGPGAHIEEGNAVGGGAAILSSSAAWDRPTAGPSGPSGGPGQGGVDDDEDDDDDDDEESPPALMERKTLAAQKEDALLRRTTAQREAPAFSSGAGAAADDLDFVSARDQAAAAERAAAVKAAAASKKRPPPGGGSKSSVTTEVVSRAAASAPSSTIARDHRRPQQQQQHEAAARSATMAAAESAGSIISLGNITALGALAHELQSTTLPMTIDKFFEHFLADDAGYSLAKFHEFQRDEEVSVTPWTEVPANKPTADGSEHTRVLRFRRRLKSPIGPASTRTTKMQRCRTFSRRGIVVNTVMTMEDIPYRDCFTVEDRWVAEPTADKRKTRVRFEFQVVWTKATIWKRRIEASSKADLEGFYDAYVRGAHAYVDDLDAREKKLAAKKRQLQQEKQRGGGRRRPGGPDDHLLGDDSTRRGPVVLQSKLDAARDLFHSVFVVHRISWLFALFILLFITLLKQHYALEENFKVQQQLLSELAALRADLACARGNS